MPSPTMTLIQSVTVGAGGAANITFSSIPSTYTDLLIKFSGRTAAASDLDFGFIKPNAATTNYTSRRVRGNGASASSSSFTDFLYLPINGSTTTSNTFTNAEIYVPNYAGSNYKSFSYDAVTENNGTTAYAELWAGLWSSTSAITSIVIGDSGSNLVQYSTAYLYGVKNA